MHEFVSVIIPTYNRCEWLPDAIESVLCQTWPHFELIVVDDGSDDGTDRMMQTRFPQVRYVRQDNRGPAAARNTGIRQARHRLLAFLDSDDRFDRRKLEIQLAAMRSQPDYLVSHTGEQWFRRGKHLNQKKRHRKESGNIFQRCLELCVVGMSTVMVRQELFDTIGLFDETLPCCEDYELWLRVSARHLFLLVDEPLTIKHGGRPDQVSVQHRTGMDRFRIAAIHGLLASDMLDPEQKRLACAELIRKCRIYAIGCMKHGKEDEGSIYFRLADDFSGSL